MKTPKEFDYDLWTAEDGQCMVRVKATREVCAVEQAVFRALRAEEKRLRREMSGAPTLQVDAEGNTIRAAMLSTDFLCAEDDEDMEPGWLADPEDFVERLQLKENVQRLCAQLTPRQLEVFRECILQGVGLREYARYTSTSFKTVWETAEAIRKKARKIFGDTPSNVKKMSV